MDERGEHQPGHDDLRHAKPEDRAAHVPQAARREFEPDEEEQKGDAELGEGELRFAAADKAEPVRPDDRARDQIAEHPAAAEPPKDQPDKRPNPEQDPAYH